MPDVNDFAAEPAAAGTAGPSLAHRVTELEERLARLEAALGVADEPPDASGPGEGM